MAADVKRLPGVVVHFHNHRVQFHAPLGRFHLDWHRRQKLLHNRIFFHPDDGIIGPRHPAIRLVGSAAGKNARIRGRDMRVRSHHRRNPPVQIPSHRHLLAGHFRVEIHEPHLHVVRDGFQQLIHLPEGAIGLRHINAPLDIHHGATRAGGRGVDIQSRAWRRVRVVCGTKQARLPAQVVVDIPLVPDVVAGRHHINAVTVELLGNIRRNAEARRGVLSVGDHHIDPLRFADVRQVIRHNMPSRMTEDVADEE